MTKRLLVFTFAGLLMATFPLTVAASEMEFAASEQVEEHVEITIDKQTVYIKVIPDVKSSGAYTLSWK